MLTKTATTISDLLEKEDSKTDLPSPERQRIMDLVESLGRLEHWNADEFTSATEISDALCKADAKKEARARERDFEDWIWTVLKMG